MSSAAAPADAAPKKKGGLKGMLIMVIGALVLIGGGVGAGLYAAGAGLVGGHQGPKIDPNAPKLVLKEGEEGHAEEAAPAPAPEGDGHEPKNFDPAKYKASYYTFEQPFTANLRDSDSFAQVGLSVSTFYDNKVIDNIKDNETPIRSAILMTMGQQDAFSIASPEGKLKLQKELTDTINTILKQRSGYAGVDNVYFTSLVIQ